MMASRSILNNLLLALALAWPMSAWDPVPLMVNGTGRPLRLVPYATFQTLAENRFAVEVANEADLATTVVDFSSRERPVIELGRGARVSVTLLGCEEAFGGLGFYVVVPGEEDDLLSKAGFLVLSLHLDQGQPWVQVRRGSEPGFVFKALALGGQ